MIKKIILIFLVLCFLSVNTYGIISQNYMEESAKCLKHPMKRSYSEWAFVNLNKYVVGGSWGTEGKGQCTWYLEDVNEYTLKGYFGYTTRKELEKKWKGKPKPKGFDEFFKLYPKDFLYNEGK